MYELLIVSKISESDVLLGKVEKTLKDIQATEVKVEKLGKKILAYPIKKQTEADYAVFNFNAAGNFIRDITDMLRLEQETLLRYLITVKKTRKLRKKLKKVEEKIVEKKEESKPKVTVVTKTRVKGKETLRSSLGQASGRVEKNKVTKAKKGTREKTKKDTNKVRKAKK